MNMYERIEFLRKKEGISQGNLEKTLKMSNGSISKWKTSMPKPERLQKIADHFGVTIDFLMGKDNRIQCKECGQVYNPIDELERSLHDAYHQKCIIATEKYPFLMDANYEAGLAESYEYQDFRNQTLSDEARINAFDNYLKAKFTSYLSRKGFEIDGVDFEDFCKSEVSMIETDSSVSEELIAKLAEKYDVDITMLDTNSRLLARANKNAQLMRLLAYAEKLNPEMLNTIEIQLKALAEQASKNEAQSSLIVTFPTAGDTEELNAAHERTDIPVTQADIQYDEDMMDGDNF